MADRSYGVRWLTVLLAIVCGFQPALAQTGTVVGRATDALTSASVSSAQVHLEGMGTGVLVNVDGRFRLANVPAGAHTISVRGIGYKPTTLAFTLAPGETKTLDVSLTPSGLELDAVVVTGSVGDTRRRAVGNSVGVIDAIDVVSRSSVANLAEVVQAKTPGLALLQPSGTAGTAASFRLRGTGSLGAGNSPTVYVDGVRLSSRDQGNYDVFGQTTSALDAVNPSDMESIEVIKGPSAATLYGSEAAAGVMQIITKSGRPGQTRWEARFEAGRSDWDPALRPVNYAVATADRLADPASWPGFVGRSLGDVLAVRVLDDGGALRSASTSKLYLSASGGADRYRFFVSAGKADQQGVLSNNFSNLRSLRANIALVPASTFTFTTNVGLSRNHVRLPLNDDAGPLGLVSSAYLAVPGRRYTFPGGENYSSIIPAVANTYDNQTRADRFTIGASATYAPMRWLRNTLQVGLDDNVGRAELYFAPDPLNLRPFAARGSLAIDNSKGLIAEGRPINREVTLSYDGTVTHQISDRLVSTSSIGVQYLSNDFERTDAIGVDLGSGNLRSVAAAAVTSSTELGSEQKSLGFYLQQQLSLRDRLFVTVATRMDNNSAFNDALQRVFYPKASVSYVLSDEPFFKVPGVSALRLRAAWGQAGNSPGPFDARRSYTSSTVTYENGSSSALRYASPGNPDLRPERASELELGFDGAVLGDRVDLDVSYYRKTTRDALIGVPSAPSSGFTGDQLTNLGEILNTGVEMLLHAVPVRRRWVTVDATVAASANRNELVSFGDERSPIVFGFNAPSQRFQEGYSLGGMWAQRVQYNADGSLVKVGGRPVADTTSVYMGPSVPTRELSLSSGVLLFGALRLHALADYKGGHYQFNVKDLRRDRDGVSWETVDPATDPDEVLVRRSLFQTYLHIQPADFIKLRDVSVGYDLPRRALLGVAQRATLTLAGHNLKIWTRYGGADPEVNYSGAGRFNRDDLWVVPQTRRYSFALDLTF